MNNIVIDKELICEDCVLSSLDYNYYCIKEGIKVIVNIDRKTIEKCIFDIESDAHLIINKFYNEEEVSEELTFNLNGVNSRIDYNFSTLSYCNQKYILNINHNNKYTSSNVINRGVVKNDSSLVFEVNSKVEKGNKKSILNQESKIIIMSKNNSIIKPNLFIDEFDVDARHAASIGKFNKDDIFYLMSKGISKEQSINLLINGFLNGRVRG